MGKREEKILSKKRREKERDRGMIVVFAVINRVILPSSGRKKERTKKRERGHAQRGRGKARGQRERTKREDKKRRRQEKILLNA